MTSATPILTHGSRQSPRHELVGIAVAIGVSLGALCVWFLATLGGIRVMTWLTPRPLPKWHERLASLPALPVLGIDVAAHGRDAYMQTCVTCHSSSGLGVRGLGIDLVHSDFVADRSDAELLAFVVRGRGIGDPLNTTKVAMPPRGGNDQMTDDDLAAAVAYLRGLQDPRRMPQLPAWTPPVLVVTEADKTAALSAAGGDAELAAYIASGNKIFHSVCIACHGREGAGIAGNGKALARNAFVQSLDDEGLLAFIKQGRAPGDPKNTTGIQMPPKGGNPALSDDDLLDIISYLRTIQNEPQSTTQTK